MLKPEHRKFAELIVQGYTAKAAYLACFPGGTERTSRSWGSVIQHRPEVVAYIAKLRAELAEKVRAETVVTLKETLEYLAAVVRTPASQVEEGHRLGQKFKRTPRTREVKLPCKLRAAELAMKLQGLLSDKAQHEAGDTLKDFLASLGEGQ